MLRTLSDVWPWTSERFSRHMASLPFPPFCCPNQPFDSYLPLSCAVINDHGPMHPQLRRSQQMGAGRSQWDANDPDGNEEQTASGWHEVFFFYQTITTTATVAESSAYEETVLNIARRVFNEAKWRSLLFAFS